MSKKNTRLNRALTFLMAVALIVGSIHLVAADNGNQYDAQEDFYVMQGDPDFKLTDAVGETPDGYTLSVVNDGDFDINAIGSYEVTYALTPVETSGGVRQVLMA